MTKYKDIKEVNFNNITDTGTEGTKVAVGTNAQRGSTQGQLRFNTDIGLAEYYDGSAFISIDSPPIISSISPSSLGESVLGSSQTIVVTGSNFGLNSTVKIVGNDGTEYTPATTTRNSSSQITITTPTNLTNANEDYDIKVTNISGLTNTLANVLSINATPVFSTASGSLGTLLDSNRSSSNLTSISFSDSDSTPTVSVTSGSLPSGITLNSNGTFSGTANAISSTATSNFTVTATDGSETASRAYSITVNAPVITFATASGSIGTINDANRGSYSLSAVTATATSGTLSYAIQSGSLPSGLSLNTSTGAITGTANAVSSNTTSTFTIRATTTSASVFADRAFSILVNAPVITFNTASGSIGTILDNQRSSYTLSPVTATVTSGTLSYAVVTGSLPTGVSLNTTTGAITGTFTAVTSTTTSTFTIRATTTSASKTADRQFSITVKPSITLSVSGNIYNGTATNITITATNTDGTVDIIFKEGATTLSTLSNQTLSSNSKTVAVPSAVYNQTIGDTISITVDDGGNVSNAITRTVLSLPTGGSITTSGGYRIHTFTSSGTFVNNISNLSVEYLVIAGGGGGGYDYGGGGGAGGYRTSVSGATSGRNSTAESQLVLTTGNKTVTVGGGGGSGGNGSSSTFHTITSNGGGFGSGESNQSNAGSGGCGGGASYSTGRGSGTAGQGFDGGSSVNNSPYTGGGGGGAGANGGSASGATNGVGGNGLSSSITGSAVTRAGGGGVGYVSDSGASRTLGGSGGGGAGGAGANSSGSSGTANTGGGGGGAGGNGGGSGGSGGSGIVIVRYLL